MGGGEPKPAAAEVEGYPPHLQVRFATESHATTQRPPGC
jgi:hypothetical protein